MDNVRDDILEIFLAQKPGFFVRGMLKPLTLTKIEHITELDQTVADSYNAAAKIGNEKLLFHGTPLKTQQIIRKSGFELKPDMPGQIGLGIYFSDLIEQSIYYQFKHDLTGEETEFSLLVCRVALGNCTERTKTCGCSWSDTPLDADSHWCRYTQGNGVGKEYCIDDTGRILPLAVMVMNLK